MARRILKDIFETTGLTATAGVGSNLYLAKIAMDIIAKHKKEDRIAALDEESFRNVLWKHEPLRDFWDIGAGMEAQLHRIGIRTMEALAHTPIQNLRNHFGIRAEGLLNRAWGRDNKIVAQMIAYQPKNNSLSAGQVLSHPPLYYR